MKNHCALPFQHMLIHTNGNYNVCCAHEVPLRDQRNIQFAAPQEWRQGRYMQTVRATFEANDRHPGCGACWQREDQGFESMRQRTAREYEITGRDVDLANIEINLGNLCNLRCLMCREEDSSAILAENQRLGIARFDQAAFDWNDDAMQHLRDLIGSQPRVINFIGGEPLYNRRMHTMIDEIPEEQARRTMLHITTNATTWNPSWEKSLSRFGSVRFMMSVDAVGDLYEYMRFPAKWDQVSRNILTMRELPRSQAMLHCTVQNLNVGSLMPLVEWAEQHELYLQVHLLTEPGWLHITNLPDSEVSSVLESLQMLIQRNATAPHLRDFAQTCYDLLFARAFDPELWQLFRDRVTQRDQVRDNSYRDFLPE